MRLVTGRKKTLNLKVGKGGEFPKHLYCDLSIPYRATSTQIQAIVADVLRRKPGATKIAGADLSGDKMPLFEGFKTLVEVTLLAKVDDAGLQAVGRHRDLEVAAFLFAQETTDRGLEALRDLSKLRLLEFVTPGAFTDQGIQHLAGLKNLEELTLGEVNGVTDAGVEVLAGLPKLRTVELRSSRITEAGWKRLKAALDAVRKGVAKAKSTGAPVAGLSSAVWEQIVRLGAKRKARMEVPSKSASWPEGFRTLFFGLKWPKRKPRADAEDPENVGWDAEFEAGSEWDAVDFDEFDACKGRSFALWGTADGNYFIALDLKSVDPFDPDLYVIDHDAFRDPLPEPVLVSEFLQKL